MSQPFDPSALPDDVARLAAAQVAAGRFTSLGDALRAGMRALSQEQRDEAKLDLLRAALVEGEQSGEAPDGASERVSAKLGLPAPR